MLRLLVAPERPCDSRELLARCSRFALQWGVVDAEAVLVMDDAAGVGRCTPLGGREIRLVPVPVATALSATVDVRSVPVSPRWATTWWPCPMSEAPLEELTA